jgi:hypothetical protein
MENSVIRTSLKGIKGRHREQVIQLFCGFALVPEDTHCPLEVLAMIFEVTCPLAASSRQGSAELSRDDVANASVEPPKPTSRLLLRKWLKVLIDRSLVLGSVDRPQLYVGCLCLMLLLLRCSEHPCTPTRTSRDACLYSRVMTFVFAGVGPILAGMTLWESL